MSLARGMTFVALWSAVLGIAISNRADAAFGQAFVRASSVPLAIAALALVLRGTDFARVAGAWSAVTILSILAAQAAYAVGMAWIVDVVLAGTCVLTVLSASIGLPGRRRDMEAAAILALLCSELSFYYIDYQARRIGPVPASALLLAWRAIVTASIAATAAFFGRVFGKASRQLSPERASTIAAVAVTIVQFAYFHIDWYTQPVLRWLQIELVMVTAITAAALSVQRAHRTLALGSLTAAGLLGILCLQFVYTYRDSLKVVGV